MTTIWWILVLRGEVLEAATHHATLWSAFGGKHWRRLMSRWRVVGQLLPLLTWEAINKSLIVFQWLTLRNSQLQQIWSKMRMTGVHFLGESWSANHMMLSNHWTQQLAILIIRLQLVTSIGERSHHSSLKGKQQRLWRRNKIQRFLIKINQVQSISRSLVKRMQFRFPRRRLFTREAVRRRASIMI